MAILTILRLEILELTKNRCAAELLEFFKNQRSGWFKITLQEIREKFRGLYGKDAIAAATRLLDELGLVRRRKQPYNGQDKTWQYRFDKEQMDKQQTWMAQGWCPLPDSFENKSAPEVEKSPLKVEESPLEVENQALSIYIDPYSLDPVNSDPPTNSVEGRKNFDQEEEIRVALAAAPFMQSENLDANCSTWEDPNTDLAQKHEEEILVAITNAFLMKDVEDLQKPSPKTEHKRETNFSAAATRDFLRRLRDLNVPMTEEVRGLVQKTPETQMERNVSAMEEESHAKGLRSPIAAFKHFVKNNCQPRDDAKSWFDRAATALGKERRDRLIQAVTEYAGVVYVFFKNGQQIALTAAQSMSWGAIADLGSGL